MSLTKIPLLISTFMIATIIISVSAFADSADTVRIDTVTAFPTGTATLPIYFSNIEPLSAVEVVLKYDSTLLSVDSFSTAGGRIEYIPNGNISFNDSANYIDLWIPDWTGFIPAGSGLLCNLYFSVEAIAAGDTIEVDSAYWPNMLFRSTIFSDSVANTIIPEFIKGAIIVLDAPPNADSVWIDSVEASAGSQVTIDIYGLNEEDLAKIDLSIEYSSDNLIYNSTSFDGTRGENAQKLIEPHPSSRQIHIGLTYSEASPLEPGQGPLATITFDIAPATPDGLIRIDSASYLDIQPLEFHQTINAGGLTFSPRFGAGFVEIKTHTDINDDNQPVLPTDYLLAQNIPNPFNPSTTIQFDLPASSNVRLDVLNILGQNVRTLVDEHLPAGSYSIRFDGMTKDNKILSSGIYFYRLKTEEFIQSKKMILLK